MYKRQVKDLKDKEYAESNYVILSTKKGLIKKTSLEAYSRPRSNGINAVTIREGDELLSARLTNGDSEILLGLKSGKAIRFHESKARAVGRTAMGVRGVSLATPEDEVIGMVCINDASSDILVVSENGYGKKTNLDDFPSHNRGGQGVANIECSARNGPVVASYVASEDDQIMLVTNSGKLIRIRVHGGEGDSIRVAGRKTQGVRLFDVDDEEKVVSVALLTESDEEENTDENDNEVATD